MEVNIYSRKAIEKLLQSNFPKNVAVISFYDPVNRRTGERDKPVNYSLKTGRVFPVAIHDIDLEILPKYGLTYDTYFPEADNLAEFIYSAYNASVNMDRAGAPPVLQQYWNIFIKTAFLYLQIIAIIRIRWCSTRYSTH